MRHFRLFAIVLISVGCLLQGLGHGAGGSEEEGDLVTPEQVFRFAVHGLRLGLSRSDVESHIGVGIKSTHGLYMYESIEDVLLAIEYGPGETVVGAWLIADEQQKYELCF